ncbi:hypothetical protein [Flavobacterium aquatile]|uniref:hypothetical protein n=1 Tax=Flavobacterium aquatile TaxID=245 RepID=UPI000A683756|nr:hypothetical protein [Flavobacterium aquatile]GEC79561.1 hypothetical protein FAQ01_24310 [Flavobacterium aquatile]
MNDKEKKEAVVKKDCFAMALFAFDVAESFYGEMDDVEATDYLNWAYNQCMTT